MEEAKSCGRAARRWKTQMDSMRRELALETKHLKKLRSYDYTKKTIANMENVIFTC